MGSGSRGATDPDAVGSTRDPRERWNQYKNPITNPGDTDRPGASTPPDAGAGVPANGR